MKIQEGFNRLAPFYTLLTRIVFGKTLEQAQLHFTDTIKENDVVLILGGGDGTFMKKLLTLKPSLHIDYIDLSSTMIEMARNKTKSASTINFIIGTEQNIPDRMYDVVITNFYLDLFSSGSLTNVIQIIKPHLKTSGQWLVTDFVSKTTWHKFLLWVMYRFFRITADIEAQRLPNWEEKLMQAEFVSTDSKEFYGRFIKTVCYTPTV